MQHGGAFGISGQLDGLGLPGICYENNFLQIRAASLTVPPILAPDTVFITTR